MRHVMSNAISENSSFLHGSARTENTAELLSSAKMKGFTPKDSSDSDDSVAVNRMRRERTKESLLDFLKQEIESPVQTEVLLQQRLEILKEAHRQQLQRMEHKHQQSLERRISHNSLLAEGNQRNTSTDWHLEERLSSNKRNKTGVKPSLETPRCKGLKKYQSMSDLSSVGAIPSKASQPRASQRSAATSTAWHSSIPRPFIMSQESKRMADEAECQKQFRAAPVPEHVHRLLYHDITEAKEKAKKTSVEQRKEFLLSTMRPFSFLEREEKKRKEFTEHLGNSAILRTTTKSPEVRRSIPKVASDASVTDHLKEKEQDRNIQTQHTAPEMLKCSMAPIESQTHKQNPEERSADRTKKRILGFLEERPTFKPTTNSKVPDFDRMYWAFQKEALRRAKMKDATKCQPFNLRTSDLPPRQSQKKSEPSQELVGKTHLKRSHSFSGITSLSTDTLPTYITDDTRKRCSAIRRSMEDKISKEQENAKWMQVHKKKSQSMKNTVTSRAKAMDPHRSLKEVYQEKLKQHRQTDQNRMKEYNRELQEMKTRVKVRPYLFEQVSQKNAKSGAERQYRVRLEQAGFSEHFVRRTGESVGEGESIRATPPFTSDDEDLSSENATQQTCIGMEGSAEICVEENEVYETEKTS